MSTEDLEDYLATLHGLTSGAETEIDPQRAGDLQAFRDIAEEQKERGVRIEIRDEEGS